MEERHEDVIEDGPYKARIVLDSIGPNDVRLTTFEITYPRFVHAEFMTHRMFSRNSASSRAIPTNKLLEQIEHNPALPVWWGKNQSGMQAKEELDGLSQDVARGLWFIAKRIATDLAKQLHAVGLHKQLANRLIEPWMSITVVWTATEHGNSKGLRVHPDAQPEIEKIMRMAYELHHEHAPMARRAGDWHLR